MGIEGGLKERPDAWMYSAEAVAETLYPGVLQKLRSFQPEGDRAVIQGMLRAEGVQVVDDSEIAKLWLLSRFDERAHGRMSDMIRQGLCTSDDIAHVFFRMAEMGLF